MSPQVVVTQDPDPKARFRRRIVACVTALREEQLLTAVVHRKQKIAKLLEGCPTEDEAWRPNDPTWIYDFEEAVVEWFTEGLFA